MALLLHKIKPWKTPPVVFNVLNVHKSSSAPPQEAVFIEKSFEVPVVVLSEEASIDFIGPPHPVSNLRPVIRHQLLHESLLQEQLRKMHDATQEWNQNFWINHNTKFVQERQKYVTSKQIGKETKQLTADEMSEFYKKFLDENWITHVKYNKEWYKRNFKLLFLSFRVYLERSCSKFL